MVAFSVLSDESAQKTHKRTLKLTPNKKALNDKSLKA
jgi:hypothetical protein